MIDGYIRKNNFIRRLIWVYDVRRDTDELDNNVMRWIVSTGHNFTMVITKIDKVSKNEAFQKKRLFEKNFGNDRVFIFSSKDGYGREILLSHIFNIAK